MPSEKSEAILFEPWRRLVVLDQGITRMQDKISIVPARMIESEVIYEEEIAPNISLHALKGLKEGIEDKEVAKRMIKILGSIPFDTICTLKNSILV